MKFFSLSLFSKNKTKWKMNEERSNHSWNAEQTDSKCGFMKTRLGISPHFYIQKKEEMIIYVFMIKLKAHRRKRDTMTMYTCK